MFIKFARLQEAEADHPTHAGPHREEPTSGGVGGGSAGDGVRASTVSQVVGIGIVGRRGMGVAYGADGLPVTVGDEAATASGPGLGPGVMPSCLPPMQPQHNQPDNR